MSAAYNQDFTELADRYLLLGSPADVRRRLAEFVDAGVEHVILSIAAADCDHARVHRTLLDEVIPGLRTR